MADPIETFHFGYIIDIQKKNLKKNRRDPTPLKTDKELNAFTVFLTNILCLSTREHWCRCLMIETH